MIFVDLWYYVGDNLNINVMYMFLMLVVSRNRFNLKNEISTKIDEKFNDFKIVIIAEIREQIKQ